MDAILVKALNEGLGYALFCVLLCYILKKQDTRDAKSELRETTYQNIIKDLTKNFELITIISCKVDKVADTVEEILKK